MTRIRPTFLAMLASTMSCVLVSTACHPPVVHDILSFDDQQVVALNRTAARNVRPDITQCASPLAPGADVSRGFLREFAGANASSLDHATIPFEWAPVIPGPIAAVGDHIATTVHTPEFFASGRVASWDTGAVDIKFSHPFGWRDFSAANSVDQSVNVILDPAYDFLRFSGPNDSLHVELEAGAWPVRDFGFTPQPGDRTVMFGNWIMDCGHPENWGAEIHPPTFIAFARIRDGATVSHAFANPYRVTQLFAMDPARATAFDDEARYTDRLTYPFARFFYERLDDHKDPSNSGPVFVHPIIESTQFNVFSWYVCAPPKPREDVLLDVSYHFTERTGVAIQVVPDANLGCARIIAAMGANYKPMALDRQDYHWPWANIDSDATKANNDNPVDVVGLVKAKFDQLFVVALGDPLIAYQIVKADEDHVLGQPVVIDRYSPLKPLGGAADSTRGIVTSDAQPFPFYGWTRVFWRKVSLVPPVAASLAGFIVDPAALNFASPGQSLSVTLTPNSSDAAPTIQSATLLGADASQFRVAADACSGHQPPTAGCKITVTFLRSTHLGMMAATLRITGSKGWAEVALAAPGLIQ